ncbi:MAG: mechanosensitive ion channel [Alphaproteobacteria bacterium]|nr:mechanosensitive ion channel [Alphaproteobacteria bacterium]
MDLETLTAWSSEHATALGTAGAILLVALVAAAWLRRALLRAAEQAEADHEARAHVPGELPLTPAEETTTEPRPPPDPTAEGPPPAAPPPANLVRATAAMAPVLVMLVGVAAALEVTGLLPVGEWVAVSHEALTRPLTGNTEDPITALSLLTLLFWLGAGWWTSRLLQRALGRTMTRRGSDEGVVASMQRLLHYVMLLLALGVGLEAAGFDLSAIFAASAVFAVGISFGLQNIVKNFVSGIILLIEQSIKPGDFLTVDGRLVRVRELGVRATIAVTLDDDTIIIPNSTLIENSVVNHSLGTDVVRARAQVGVHYDSDLDVVRKALEQASRRFRPRETHHDPVVLLTGFGSSSVDFEVSIWIGNAFLRPRILSQLRHALWNALKEADVVIAYPQIDVHLDGVVLEALRRRGSRATPADEREA